MFKFGKLTGLYYYIKLLRAFPMLCGCLQGATLDAISKVSDQNMSGTQLGVPHWIPLASSFSGPVCLALPAWSSFQCQPYLAAHSGL